MGRLWLLKAGGGKTRSSLSTCFALLEDRIILCSIVGGYGKEMEDAHNSITALLNLQEFKDRMKEFITQKDVTSKNEGQRDFKMGMRLRMAQGDFFHLSNGAYLSSTLVPISAGKDMKTYFFGFDRDGHFTMDADDVNYVMMASVPRSVKEDPSPKGVTKLINLITNPKEADIKFLVSVEVVQDHEKRLRLKGLPYVKIAENAVLPPDTVLYPQYDLAQPSAASFDSSVSNSVKAKMSAIFVNKILPQCSVESMTRFLCSPDLMMKKMQDILRVVVKNNSSSKAIVSQTELRKFEALLKKEFDFTDNAQDGDKWLHELARLFCIYDAINKSYEGFSKCNPTKFVKEDSIITRLSKVGTPIVTFTPVMAILFKLNRCIIDSASIFIFKAGNSQAMSGGISANLFISLVSSTSSECILTYPPFGDRDPLLAIDLEGYTNGSVAGYADPEDPTLFHTLFVTTRDTEVRNRAKFFFLSNKRFSYGNTHVHDRQNGKVLPYAELGLTGPYDPSLVVTPLNAPNVGKWCFFNRDSLGRQRTSSRGVDVQTAEYDQWANF